jgi:hypothetical protein
MIHSKGSTGIKSRFVFNLAFLAFVSIILAWATPGCVSNQLKRSTETEAAGALLEKSNRYVQSAWQQISLKSTVEKRLQDIQLNLSLALASQTNRFDARPNPLTADLEKQLLEYQKLLTEAVKDESVRLETQAEKHREHLEFYYKMILTFLGICGAILTYFFAKSLHEARATIRSSIESISSKAELEFNETIAKSIAGFDTALASSRLSAESAVRNFEKEYSADRRSVIWLSSIIARAYVVLSHPKIKDPNEKTFINSERKEVIALLNHIQIKWAPTNRTITIALGRLYRIAGEYQSAFDEVQKVLNILDPMDADYAQDRADFLYNQACYMNLLANQLGESDKKYEELKTLAWKLLKESINLRLENLEDAKGDSDFTGLFNSSRRLDQLLNAKSTPEIQA